MIRFACPRCRTIHSAPDHAAGKKSRCPKCGQRLQIPIPQEELMPAPLVPAVEPRLLKPHAVNPAPIPTVPPNLQVIISPPAQNTPTPAQSKPGNQQIVVHMEHPAINQFPHILHLGLTLATCGLWVFIWVLHYIIWSSGPIGRLFWYLILFVVPGVLIYGYATGELNDWLRGFQDWFNNDFLPWVNNDLRNWINQ